MTSVHATILRTVLIAGLITTAWPGTMTTAEAQGWSCGKRGAWVCTLNGWRAGTATRSMQGTHIECGGGFLGIPGICGDRSHSQPATWVDIVGGISESCEDHSTSFFGPLAGEWDGCNGADLQVSTGYQPIEGVNPNGGWWPFPAGEIVEWDDGQCVDPFFGTPPTPPYAWFHTSPRAFPTSGAFATVYDLDYCFDKQLMGTIYWPTFDVVATVVSDAPTRKEVEIVGVAPEACSVPESACTNKLLCSDLIVQTQQVCEWRWHEPRTRCDLGC